MAQLEEAAYWPKVEDMPFIWCQTNPEKRVWIDGWQQIDFTNFNFMDRSYAEPKRGNRNINGIALVLGQTIHKQYYTFALDFDGWDAVLAWFGSWENVQSLAQKTRIEWHGEKSNIHVLFKSKTYLGDGKNCRIEDIGPDKEKIDIRIERQLLFSWPSMHPKNEIFTPLGTERILELDTTEMRKMWDKVRRLSAEYTSNVNRRKYIQDIERRHDMNTGQGIHYALVDLAITYYLGLYGECKGLTDGERLTELIKWGSKQNRHSQTEINGVWEWVERTFYNDKEESRARGEAAGRASEEEEKKKHIETVFKYSKNKKQALHEAIILGDKPVFITYDKGIGIIKSLEQIEEDNRIIAPHNLENYSDDPYEFENMNEVLSYMERAKTATIDSLYQQSKQIAKDYNDQSIEKICLLAINIIASYFQDHFPTTHYDIILGFNGSGKSSFAITYNAIGYRVVNLTSPNAANINRILGKIEAGQCTLVLDEVKGLEKNSDLLSVLATGYDAKGKVSKVNDFTRRPEYFSTFCYKLIIGEGLSNLRELKGVMDRSFKFSAYRGNPKYDIKETLEPQGNKRRKVRLDQLKDFRKLMMVYRLLNFDVEIPDIDVGVDGREKELVKPILQLFFGCEAQREVEATLQAFLNQMNEKKDATMEPLLHRILTDIIGITKNNEEGFISHSKFARKNKNEDKDRWKYGGH